MLVSKLIAKLQDVLERDGDINVYTLDMDTPRLKLCDPSDEDEEGDPNRGKAYLCIE